MPSAKERREIETATANFSVGRIVVPAITTREKGGMMVERFAWPISSQTINQMISEKTIGIFLPSRVKPSS